MALSEYEQRKLNEMERSLHSDDPALATILDSGVVRHLGRVIAALSLPAVGIVLSVRGFVAMGVAPGCMSRVGPATGTLPPPDPARVTLRRCPGAPDWKSGSRLVSVTLANS